jgi:hypothetical protein
MFIIRIILCVLFIGSITYGTESFLPQEQTVLLPFASNLNADRALVDIPITNPSLIKRANSFEILVEQQRKLINNCIPLYPGIGATATGINMTPDRVVAEIEIVREQKLSGFVIFNLDGQTINTIPPMLKLGVTGKK